MDLSNSWHRYDDWHDDNDDGETNLTIDKNAYSADGSVAMIDIPTLDVPILHSCRAKLPSGRLCPRQDRRVCPLHGEIVERDENGIPLSGKSETLKAMFAEDNERVKRKKKTRPDIRDKIMKQIKKSKHM